MQFSRLLILILIGGAMLSSCEKRRELPQSPRPPTLEKSTASVAPNVPVAKPTEVTSPWSLLTQLSDHLDSSSRDKVFHDTAVSMTETDNLQQALSLVEKMNDNEKARALQDIVKTLIETKNIPQAIEVAKQLDAQSQKRAYYDIVIALVKADDLSKASAMVDALDGTMKSDALFAMIDAMMDKGDREHAKEFFPRAVAASTRNTTADNGKAKALETIANTLLKMGDKKRALESLSQALTFADKLGSKEKFDILYNSAFLYARAGDLVQAVYLTRQMDDKGKAFTFDGMASIAAEKGDLQNALALANKLEEKYRIGALYKIAVILINQGDKQGANELLAQTLAIANQLKDFYKTDFLVDVASALVKSDNLQQALGVADQLENREKVWALTEIALALNSIGDKQRSFEILEQALSVSISQQEGDQTRFDVLCNIANTLVKIDISANQQTFSPQGQKLANAILAQTIMPKSIPLTPASSSDWQ